MFAPYLAYVVVVNALLATGLMKKIVNGIAPNHVQFEWASASSFWFGRVHVRDFVVQGADDSIEWRVAVDETTASLGMTDLFVRRVRVHDAVVRGASLRMRFKLDPKDVTPAFVAALPPIEGFADPPLRPSFVPPPPTDDNYDLWTIELDDVDTSDVREVWVDSVRLTDKGGHARGGFHLKPVREVWVPPSEFTLSQAEVTIGKTVIASDVSGTFWLRIAEYDPRERKGRAALGSLDANAVARGTLGDLSFANPILPKAVALTGGGGAVATRTHVLSGVVQPGSRIACRLGDWSVWSGAHRVSGSSLVEVTIPENAKPDVEVSIESYDVGFHHGKVDVARAPTVLAFVRADAADLARESGPWKASVDMPLVDIARLAALDAYADDGMFSSGSATGKVHADLDGRAASGDATLSFSRAATKLGSALVVANGSAKVRLHHWDFDTGKADISGSSMEVHDVAFGERRGWSASFAASPADLQLSGKTALTAFVTGKLRDAQLPLEIAGAPRILENLIGTQGFAFSARLRESAGVSDFEDVRVIGDKTEVHAHYRSDAAGKNGAALVSMPLLNVGALVRAGDVSVVPFATRSWYDQTLRPGS